MRTRYLRTDQIYDFNSLQYFPPHLTTYDPANKRFFVSNLSLNRIDVFDATSEIQIASITVPSPFGLDVAPDGNTLYAATTFGDLYIIDPNGLAVTQRVPGATIGPNGYSPSQVYVLADGDLAMLGQGGGQSVDGAYSFAIWNQSTNNLSIVSAGNLGTKT